MRISDWSPDVCSSDLWIGRRGEPRCSLEDRDCQGMPLTTVSNAWREDGREAWLPSQGKPNRGRHALGQWPASRDKAKTRAPKATIGIASCRERVWTYG